jgi:hypothetical protein
VYRRACASRIAAEVVRQAPINDCNGAQCATTGPGRSETLKRQRKRFQLEAEIGGGAIQLRRPLRSPQKLSTHRNQSWLVGDFASKRALVEFTPKDRFTGTLQIS